MQVKINRKTNLLIRSVTEKSNRTEKLKPNRNRTIGSGSVFIFLKTEQIF